MTQNGLPAQEANSNLGNAGEPTPVQPGKEALEDHTQEESAARETVEFKWGRDSRNVDAEKVREFARELGASPDALRTWVQLGRDGGSIYSEVRRREQELARREAEIAAREQRMETPPPPVERRPERPRRSVAENPVEFWDDLATRTDKLDKLDRLDRIESMLENVNKRYEQEREELNDYQLEQSFIREHADYMKELRERDPDLPQVDLQTIARHLDQFVTEIPPGTSIRELVETGYRLATWEDVGRIRARKQIERQTQPRARMEMPSAQPQMNLPETGPKPNETLEERRARLHRQVGGMTFQELHAMESRDGR